MRNAECGIAIGDFGQEDNDTPVVPPFLTPHFTFRIPHSAFPILPAVFKSKIQNPKSKIGTPP
jgi:hypothetical protein